MAWNVPVFSVSQAATIYALNPGDDVYVVDDVTLYASGARAITGTTGHEIVVNGSILNGSQQTMTLHAPGALSVGMSTASNCIIQVGKGGEIGSFQGGAAISIIGYGARVVNEGHIFTETAYAIEFTGMGTNAPATLVNSGLIESPSPCIIRGVSAADETIVVTNSGTIKGHNGISYGISAYTTAGRNLITNTGTMIGDIRGDNGNDIYSGASGRLTGKIFGFDGNDKLTGGINGNEFLGGNGNDTLVGNGGNDTLAGEVGNDNLNGGIGADKLDGGLGKDILTGGADADRFIFSDKTHSVVGANADRIMDFDDGNQGDRIDLSALIVPALQYIHDDAFTKIGQVRIRDVAGPDVVVELNTGGSLAADFSIRLVGTTLASMNAGDFVL